MADDSVSSDVLKEKVEQLKQSSMKIGEAMYKSAGDRGGSDQSAADYEDLKQEGKKE